MYNIKYGEKEKHSKLVTPITQMSLKILPSEKKRKENRRVFKSIIDHRVLTSAQLWRNVKHDATHSPTLLMKCWIDDGEGRSRKWKRNGGGPLIEFNWYSVGTQEVPGTRPTCRLVHSFYLFFVCVCGGGQLSIKTHKKKNEIYFWKETRIGKTGQMRRV